MGRTAGVMMRPICPGEKCARSLGPSRETRARGYGLAGNVPPLLLHFTSSAFEHGSIVSRPGSSVGRVGRSHVCRSLLSFL